MTTAASFARSTRFAERNCDRLRSTACQRRVRSSASQSAVLVLAHHFVHLGARSSALRIAATATCLGHVCVFARRLIDASRPTDVHKRATHLVTYLDSSTTTTTTVATATILTNSTTTDDTTHLDL